MKNTVVLIGSIEYSMVSIKRTVFLPTVTVLKNMVRLIGTIEYVGQGPILCTLTSKSQYC